MAGGGECGTVAAWELQGRVVRTATVLSPPLPLRTANGATWCAVLAGFLLVVTLSAGPRRPGGRSFFRRSKNRRALPRGGSLRTPLLASLTPRQDSATVRNNDASSLLISPHRSIQRRCKRNLDLKSADSTSPPACSARLCCCCLQTRLSSKRSTRAQNVQRILSASSFMASSSELTTQPSQYCQSSKPPHHRTARSASRADPDHRL